MVISSEGVFSHTVHWCFTLLSASVKFAEPYWRTKPPSPSSPRETTNLPSSLKGPVHSCSQLWENSKEHSDNNQLPFLIII